MFATRARMFRTVYLHKCAPCNYFLPFSVTLQLVLCRISCALLQGTAPLLSPLLWGAFEYVDMHPSRCLHALAQQKLEMIHNTLPTIIVCCPCRKARGVEHMVVDALLAAESTLRLADKTEDPQEFVRLDDTIIKVTAHSRSSSSCCSPKETAVISSHPFRICSLSFNVPPGISRLKVDVPCKCLCQNAKLALMLPHPACASRVGSIPGVEKLLSTFTLPPKSTFS